MVSREFKFRVWDNINKCWLNEDDYIGINNYGVVVNDRGDMDNLSLHSHATVQQSTGVYDKNGKEIYEGDICLIEYYSCTKGVYVANKEVICFENGSFIAKWFEKYQSENYGGAFLSDTNKIEIIGNVCENPDLINQ